ncbi:DivIVA domain-containing protein [Mycoplasma seminis]|uniref:DivIVA domain-containing protein n=1 Tax=Mycoplasma seminis TaxID=512749 RepID=A0ABY9HB79_9MOLU|nr:DivIVA domain-containing protein [Mycoplasma seminis]WLP85850.1 DivIVA domain-containing protein [Mycoplasma seminis]
MNKIKELSISIKDKKFSLNLEGYNKKEVDDFLQYLFINLVEEEDTKENLETQLNKYKELYKVEFDKNKVLEEENKRLSKEVEKIYE